MVAAVAARTVILLPPSESKVPRGRGRVWRPGTLALPDLDGPRARLLAVLGPDHPAATGPTRRAVDRYCGVLYKELDAASLTTAAKRRLYRNVLIVSGLWGVVGPTDPIPDYKLKMGARVAPLGKLSMWWRPQITEALVARVRGAVVWDLLPNEHAAAIDWDRLEPRHRVTIRFLDREGRTVSHWNKLLKGSIVRWLAESGSADPAALAGFEHPQGYRFDPESSVLGGRLSTVVLREVPRPPRPRSDRLGP